MCAPAICAMSPLPSAFAPSAGHVPAACSIGLATHDAATLLVLPRTRLLSALPVVLTLTSLSLSPRGASPKCLYAVTMRRLALPATNVKGMYPAPHIHEHFTIHKWLRQTAYILTHNLNMLEHIANNGMNTTMHTDANIAQF